MSDTAKVALFFNERGGKYAGGGYIGLYRMQATQLSDKQKQEKRS
jgi:hypothetical protein